MWIFAGSFGLFGAGMAAYCYRTHKKIKKMQDTPTTDIRYLDVGEFEVKASISEKSALIVSPLSEVDCVWFCIKVEEYVKRGKRGSWVTRVNLSNQGDCILDDGTGECRLDLFEIDFEFSKEYSGKSGTLDNPTEKEMRVLQKYGMDPESFLGFNKNLRYTEYVLRHDDELYVLGSCEEVKGSDEMIMRGSKDDKLFISDKSEEALVSKFKNQLLLQGLGAGGFLLAALVMFVVAIFQ